MQFINFIEVFCELVEHDVNSVSTSCVAINSVEHACLKIKNSLIHSNPLVSSRIFPIPAQICLHPE